LMTKPHNRSGNRETELNTKQETESITKPRSARLRGTTSGSLWMTVNDGTVTYLRRIKHLSDLVDAEKSLNASVVQIQSETLDTFTSVQPENGRKRSKEERDQKALNELNRLKEEHNKTKEIK